jgi:heavy metal efflux system protein
VSLVERLVRWALAQRAFVLLSVVALVVTGIVAYRDLDVEAFPDLTNNQVVVITAAPGLAAPEVEQRVTYPLETSLLGLPRTEEVRSISKFALSIVTIVFEDGVPVYLARQLVTERVNEARDRLPAGLTPALGPVATAFGEIYQYLVEAPPELALETRAFHDWEMRTRLRAVPGVSDVNSWGGWSRTYEVVVDPFRLEQHGLTLADVTAALDANNRSFSGGFLESRSERLAVRGVGLLRDERDILQTVIRASAGTPLRVSDVADVRTGHLPREGAVTRDGRGEVLSGMVIMLQGENGRDVASAVKQQIDEIRKTLPARTTIVPFYDQSEVIERTARTVRRNLTEGVVLVIIVLVLFLRNLRVALIVTLVMPLALLSGFIGMRLTGVSANLMSLGAIDFGLMVDGAIVMIESIVRRRQKLRSEGTVPAARLREVDASAAAEVARPVLFGIVIILAVYLPLFALEGLEGKMFRPMAITMCAALFGALLLTLTAVPVAANLTLGPTAIQPEQAWFERLRAAYLRVLAGALRRVSLTLALAGSAIIVAIGSVPWLGTEFMPRLDEGAILIETRLLPSVSLGESAAAATLVERRILEFPEVRQVVTKMGRPDLATEAMGLYQGDVYVNLHPMREWTTGRSRDQLIDGMAEALSVFPGMTSSFTQPMAMRLDEVVSGVRADLALKIFGPDIATLERLSQEALERLAGIEGLADLQTEALFGATQLEVLIDPDAAARYGLPVARLQEVVEAATGGTTATELLDGARRFPVLVRLPDAYRASPEALTTLPLVAPGGERLRLGQVATVRQVAAQEVIHHEHGERRVVVQGNARGRDIGGVVADAQARLATLALPPGYYLAWSGQFEHQARATARLALIIPLSLVIIFLVLFAAFGLVRQPVMILLIVPFALIGGIAALWLRGMTLNLSASVGFIALFGIAITDGIVLITAINQLRAAGAPLRDAILEGAATRVKPVLMTTLVAAFGFVPMAFNQTPGSEVQRPLATVVIGGVMTSTLLTLLVLPVVYEIVERRVEARRRRGNG